MNNKKWYILTVLFLMGALFLSACGGAEPEAEETVDEPATTTETEEMVEEEAPAEEEAVVEEEAPAEEEAVVEEEAPAEEVVEEEAPAEEEVVEEAASEFDVNITIWSDDLLTPVILGLKESFEAEYGIGLIVEKRAGPQRPIPHRRPGWRRPGHHHAAPRPFGWFC
jgi:hypothetical protein